MSAHRLINILLALAIAAAMCAAILLDGPSDTQAAQDHATSLQDARQAARTEQHLAKARKAAGVAL